MRFRMIITAVRSLLLRLLKECKTDVIGYWSIRSIVKCEENGTIITGRGLTLEEGVKLKAVKGTLTIGKGCYFNMNCAVTAVENVSIGDLVSVGNNTVIVDHDHDIHGSSNGLISKAVTIGDHVWIGANCVILRGTRIGDHAVIAAGSVVRGDIPEKCLYYQKRSTYIKEIES